MVEKNDEEEKRRRRRRRRVLFAKLSKQTTHKNIIKNGVVYRTQQEFKVVKKRRNRPRTCLILFFLELQSFLFEKIFDHY